MDIEVDQNSDFTKDITRKSHQHHKTEQFLDEKYWRFWDTGKIL